MATQRGRIPWWGVVDAEPSDDPGRDPYVHQTMAARGLFLRRVNVNMTRQQTPAGDAAIDRLIVSAYNAGVYLLPILTRTDSSPQANPAPPRTAQELDAWRNWCNTMVSRYQGYIDVWEIWNEPNLAWPGLGSGVVPTDQNVRTAAQQYAPVLQAAAQGIRPASSTARILSGGLAMRAGQNHLPAAFFDEVMRNSDARYWFDAVSIHPYSQQSSVVDMKNQIASFRAAADQRDPNVPLWITEYAWNATFDRWEAAFPAGDRNVTPQQSQSTVDSLQKDLQSNVLLQIGPQSRSQPDNFCAVNRIGNFCWWKLLSPPPPPPPQPPPIDRVGLWFDGSVAERPVGAALVNAHASDGFTGLPVRRS